MKASKRTSVTQAVNQVMKNSKHMVVVFELDSENTLHLLRLTNDFPVAHFNEAIKLLHEDLSKEVLTINQKADEDASSDS